MTQKSSYQKKSKPVETTEIIRENGDFDMYKITNRTFSAIQLFGIGVVPARGSITVAEVSDGLRAMEKKNKLSIKIVKEK